MVKLCSGGKTIQLSRDLTAYRSGLWLTLGVNGVGRWCVSKPPLRTWACSQRCLLYNFSINGTSRFCALFSIRPIFHSSTRLWKSTCSLDKRESTHTNLSLTDPIGSSTFLAEEEFSPVLNTSSLRTLHSLCCHRLEMFFLISILGSQNFFYYGLYVYSHATDIQRESRYAEYF